MSEKDLDLLYKRAAGHDQARPSAAVREAILGEARQLAANAHQRHPDMVETQPPSTKRWYASRAVPSHLLHAFAHWLRVRWKIAAPLAAAVLAVIVLQPQLRSKLPAPARQNAAPATTTATASEPVRPQTANIAETPPIAAPATAPPKAPAASASNLTSGADLATPASRASAARMRSSRSAAPLAELRERAEAESETARASATSDSELLQAAARGDVARVRSLVQMNAASINARDTRGRTALLLAVLHRHESVVRALLDGGADPNLGDADGRTPIAIARDQNQLSVAAALLRAGAR